VVIEREDKDKNLDKTQQVVHAQQVPRKKIRIVSKTMKPMMPKFTRPGIGGDIGWPGQQSTMRSAIARAHQFSEAATHERQMACPQV
jgi:hypothetical protein